MFKNEFATLCNAGRAKADFLEKIKWDILFPL